MGRDEMRCDESIGVVVCSQEDVGPGKAGSPVQWSGVQGLLCSRDSGLGSSVKGRIERVGGYRFNACQLR